MSPLLIAAPFIVVASIAFTWSLRRRRTLALAVADFGRRARRFGGA